MKRALVTKIIDGISKHGGSYKMITFKDLSGGKSMRTFIFSKCRNKARWNKVIEKGEGCVIENFIMKKEGVIDADSKFDIVKDDCPCNIDVDIHTNYRADIDG